LVFYGGDDAPGTGFPQAGLRIDNASEQAFRILLQFPGNVRVDAMLNVGSTEEDSMKKFGYVLAALGAIVIAAPSIASAETIVVRRGGDHHGYHHGYGARAQMHRDRGWHEGRRHSDRVVIVKRHRHGY
jgi:hypothetical protein